MAREWTDAGTKQRFLTSTRKLNSAGNKNNNKNSLDATFQAELWHDLRLDIVDVGLNGMLTVSFGFFSLEDSTFGPFLALDRPIDCHFWKFSVKVCHVCVAKVNHQSSILRRRRESESVTPSLRKV